MSHALQSRLDETGAHRAAFAERWVTHKMEALREAAEATGFSRFEYARAVLHYSMEELVWTARDPDVLDAALAEAVTLAQVAEGASVEQL